MRKVAIDSLTLIFAGAPTEYVVSDIEGLDDPDRRIASYESSGEDGGYIPQTLYGMRGVTITGAITSTSVSAYENARQALSAACRLRRDRYGAPQLVRVNVINNAGGDYELYAVVRSVRIDPYNGTAAGFIISLLAPDPYVYSPYGFTSGAFRTPVPGGVLIPATFPLVFGGGDGGLGLLDNWGEVETWPVVTYTGVLTNPYLYHVETGRSFQLRVMTGVADRVVIDMRAKSVILNGTTSFMPYKTPDSDWFQLVPGRNTFRFSSGSTSDTGTAEVTGKAAFLAVR